MRLARSQMGQRTAGAMHEDGAVSGASQKNPRGRISIALTGRFRAAMTPLIDFSDSDYKVSAFRASSVETTETKGWAGACAWANPAHILNAGSCAIKKKLMAVSVSVRPNPKASVRAAAWHRGGGFPRADPGVVSKDATGAMNEDSHRRPPCCKI